MKIKRTELQSCRRLCQSESPEMNLKKKTKNGRIRNKRKQVLYKICFEQEALIEKKTKRKIKPNTEMMPRK